MDNELDFEFDGEVVEWRGPAPYYFVRLDEDVSGDIKFAAQGIEYWGQVPVVVRIGETEFTTGLFPKDGTYLLPLKDAVRRAEEIELGMSIDGGLSVGHRSD